MLDLPYGWPLAAKTGLLRPVWPAFEASVQSLAGLFGQFREEVFSETGLLMLDVLGNWTSGIGSIRSGCYSYRSISIAPFLSSTCNNATYIVGVLTNARWRIFVRQVAVRGESVRWEGLPSRRTGTSKPSTPRPEGTSSAGSHTRRRVDWRGRTLRLSDGASRAAPR